MRFVLDASLTLTWCFEDESTEFTRSVLKAMPDVGAAVPDIWSYEVANGLRFGQQQNRVTEARADEFVDELKELPITKVVLWSDALLRDVRKLASRHQLSVYDASYLELAMQLGLPLGTMDGSGKKKGLKQAAIASGVKLVDKEQVEVWSRTAQEDG